MSVRRSTRLKVKEKDRLEEVLRLNTKIHSPGRSIAKRTVTSSERESSSSYGSEREPGNALVEGSSEHEREDSDDDLLVITSNKTSSAHKTNNFLRV